MLQVCTHQPSASGCFSKHIVKSNSWFYEGHPRNNCSRNVIFWPSFLFRIFYSLQLNIQRTQKYWGSMRLACESYCVLLLVGRVIPQSAHLHMTRQHSTFKIKLRRAPVAANFRADVKAMKRLVNKNTAVMVPLFLWSYWYLRGNEFQSVNNNWGSRFGQFILNVLHLLLLQCFGWSVALGCRKWL